VRREEKSDWWESEDESRDSDTGAGESSKYHAESR